MGGLESRRTWGWAAVGALLLGQWLVPVIAAPAASGADPCAPGGNKIVCENSKAGTDPNVWDITGAGDPEIQGFASDISVNVGNRIDFKIDTAASAYTIDIYRMGYYGGDGARKITSVPVTATLPQHQPECVTDPATDLYDCGNWGVSASWNVPSTAVSGVYIAHIKRSTGEGSHITFIVRDDSSHSDVVFQTADPTWHAYNMYGGANFYLGGSHGRALKLSYNRPFLTRGWENGRDFFMGSEYAMVRFMERNGYDVSYIAGVDSDRRGNLLTNHKVFLSVGHDEYWSKAQRANVTAARDAGVNLQFLAGNEVYWKTRYEPSIDGTSTANRTLVTYKETWGNAKIDPDAEWTGTYRDPRFAPVNRGGGTPENNLIGTQYMVNFSDLALKVSAAEGKFRLWRNTSLATMTSGTATLAPHTVGYESNEDVDNGHRPHGLIRLSTTTGAVPEYLQDYGNRVAPGTTTHHLTLYRAASGALVFSAGTVQWSWGLDAVHDSGYAPEPADPRMQQAQVNLFADMGVQPGSLMAGLVPATRSTDTVAPTVTISSPAAGANQSNGQQVTLTGTAADSGGGRVAGVEVSTDGGQSWSAAQGTTSWTYSYVQRGLGASAVRVRAMDDSANIGTAVQRSFTAACPCTVFGPDVPAIAATDDNYPVELGMRFTALANGFVTGARFYKGPGNTGTHVGSLWSSSGERLAQATFTGESAQGWQTVTFSTPVVAAAGESFVVSYSAPQGNYPVRTWGFADGPLENGGLLVEGGFGATPAGVFGTIGTFPSSVYQSSNYYVDPVFSTTDNSALIAMNQWPLPGSSSVPTNSVVSARYSKPIAEGSQSIVVRDANGAAVPGTTTYAPTTRTVTFTPTAPLAGFVKYTVTVSGRDAQGNNVSTGGQWQFTTVKPPGAPGVCPCSLFDDSLVPTVLEAADPDAVTLGVRFTPDTNGQVSAVRFYKGVNNKGTHTGALWSATGTLLASGTFVDESTTGWQTMVLDAPVQVRKDTTYVASYRTTVGRYSLDPNGFAAANLSRPPLTVTSSAGAYTYGTGFPGETSASNYMVDVVFDKVAPQIALAGQEPAPGAVQVPRGSKVKVGLTAAVSPGWTLAVSIGGTPVAGSVGTSADGTQLTWTPAAQLPPDALVQVSLTGVVSVEGAPLADQTWTFRTRTTETLGQQTLFGDVVPDVAAENESSPVELGTAFSSSRDGHVTAIRFFKGAGNTGTHVGSLWSADGTRLAQVTFVGESAGGWQTATLSTPVAITAGQTYVVSYLAPNGHYSHTMQFFAQPWTSGDLSAPATNNGRFLYGDAGGFPSFSWGRANYFVDVVFEREPASLAVTAQSPADGAGGVAPDAAPSISFTAPLAPGWSASVSTAAGTVAGTAALSGDGKTVTFTPGQPLAAGTAHTVTVSGLVSTEGAVLAPRTWSFTTRDADLHSLFGDATPAVSSVNDPDAVELGTAFTPGVAGEVTAIRFHKGAGNTGTHTGSLWSSSGQRLASVTFTGESASGWQSATLAQPVALAAGETYVVSYLAPNGHYSATSGFFSAPFASGPLSAPAGSNGRYLYGAGGGFPTGSYGSTNYFVDVVFRQTG